VAVAALPTPCASAVRIRNVASCFGRMPRSPIDRSIGGRSLIDLELRIAEVWPRAGLCGDALERVLDVGTLDREVGN
jgi:hypothetical protein